jgi:uncharacterized protein YdeI (YjbR/CyaY-like superfamily)
MNVEIDAFISKAKKWKEELQLLRSIILNSELKEELKWGKPCYCFNNKNVLIIQPFKEYCGLLFFNGALLKDNKKLLVKAGEHSQAGRLIQFKDKNEIEKSSKVISSFIKEAIEIEKAGTKFKSEAIAEKIEIEELQEYKKTNPAFKKAFDALTPGRQRGYLIYFSGAKQSATRIDRINKYSDKIMSGKGLNDCTCGLSKRMPICDGSHKFK